jgi:hypothetical protein
MSNLTFDRLEKMQGVVILYFKRPNRWRLGFSSMSVTIPVNNAQKLLTKLQATLS